MSVVPTEGGALERPGRGLLGLQQRYRELGRLRMGEQRTSKSGKKFPAKLGEWRLTSASYELLTVAAQVYGGEVREWADAPTEGKQYELLTGSDRLDVIVPPGLVLSQSWELWSGGGCVRRCNGAVQTTGEPCACPADLEQRAKDAALLKPTACKPTSRLSVMLPRIPDIGVWRVESHGMNAAVELPGTVDLLEKAIGAGVLIPAQLRIDQRTSKKDGETRHFVVPVLELPSITAESLLAGEVPAIGGSASGALAPPAPKAIEGGSRVTKGKAKHVEPEELPPPGAQPDKADNTADAGAAPELPDGNGTAKVNSSENQAVRRRSLEASAKQAKIDDLNAFCVDVAKRSLDEIVADDDIHDTNLVLAELRLVRSRESS